MCVASVEALGVSEALGITFEEIDRAGVVTLSRPTRLNALNREMFEALSAHYRRWAPNPQIYGVVMQSAHPSVFSSGGDLKVLQEWNEQGAQGAIREFYRAAYTHVWVLEKFIRPNVPLINGLVLGGGIGISLYGTHCVAGEGYRFGMPQVGIGFLPDIGGTYFLSRMLGRTGLYLALTGRIIGPAEAYRHRLVSHYVPAAHFSVIKDALARQPSDRPAARWLASRSRRRRTRAAYAADRPRLLARLGRGDSASASMRSRARTRTSRTRPRRRFARSRRPRSKSPSANSSAASRLSLANALKLEFRLASHLIGSHDYREGIAARIAGNGREPDWQPATLADVDDDGDRAPVHDPGRGRARVQRARLPACNRRNPPRSPKLNARISCNLKRLA